MIGINVDITDRERAEAQRDLLLAELNHRVKNTLAVVQAIAHQTFKDSKPEGLRKAFEGRIGTLAAAHNRLTQTNWESASLGQVAQDAMNTQAQSARRVSVTGPSIMLPPKEALAIAMALHELFTNAVKYGALSAECGQVDVSWEVSAGEMLSIVWQERGGPTVVPPRHKGFGSMMLERTLALDLLGAVTVEYRPEGLICRIEAPLRASVR
jgi:two-component sensor histidine kinase